MKKLVTIYHAGVFGIQKIEATLVEHGIRPYAQYTKAAFVKYIPKGKRKPTGFIVGYHPYIVIIDGHGHIDPQDALTKPNDIGNGMTTSMTRFASFDERYKTEFDANLTEYIQDKTVLMDVRHTVGTEVVNVVP